MNEWALSFLIIWTHAGNNKFRKWRDHCIYSAKNNLPIGNYTPVQWQGFGSFDRNHLWNLCSYWVVKFKYFNRAVRSRFSNRTVTLRHSITAVLLEKRKESRVSVRELILLWNSGWAKVATLFNRTETPFQKSYICHSRCIQVNF